MPNDDIKLNELGAKYNELLAFTENLTRIAEIQTSILTNLYTAIAESIPQRYLDNEYFERVGRLTIELNKHFQNEEKEG